MKLSDFLTCYLANLNIFSRPIFTVLLSLYVCSVICVHMGYKMERYDWLEPKTAGLVLCGILFDLYSAGLIVPGYGNVFRLIFWSRQFASIAVHCLFSVRLVQFCLRGPTLVPGVPTISLVD